MKTIKISTTTVKGGGWNPSGRKPKNLKSLKIANMHAIKGGSHYPGGGTI
jgi:hypothetical protein